MKLPQAVGFWLMVVVTIMSVLLLNVPLSPIQGSETTDTTIMFRTIGLSKTVYVDDNADFTSPLQVEKDTPVSLEPGKYYWRTKGLSLVSGFTIRSHVALEVTEEGENNYKITNKGNTVTDVAVKEQKGGLPVGFFVLDTKKDMTLQIKQPSVVAGGEHRED